MLKSYRWECAGGHVVGGPWDFIVIPSPFSLDFGTLDFGTSDLGLTKMAPVMAMFVRGTK